MVVGSLQLDPLGLAVIAATVRVLLDQLTLLLGVGAVILAGVALAIYLVRRRYAQDRRVAASPPASAAQQAA
jgi:hypothetical protein